MIQMRWERYPRTAGFDLARRWVTVQANLGLARNTIDAYGRALEDYLGFSERNCANVVIAGRDHIAAFVHDLTSRPNPRTSTTEMPYGGKGLANATLQQRITALRLFYDYLMEEGHRPNNPVGRGRYTPGKGFGGTRDRGLIPRYTKLPWIPNDEQWRCILAAARGQILRNRLMLALAYDSALRREELCRLEVNDIDPAFQTIRIRAENTKNRLSRVVPYSKAAGELFTAYLTRRRELTHARGRLFISESRRNCGKPISIWTWSKVVNDLAAESGVREFTTHTPRHLCLTDLARDNWDIHEIAKFAGHRSIQTTLLYIHLSGRELGAKIARGMAEIHAWRNKLTMEMLSA
jgi:site-specific recombinase XerD